jgi:hypothetical protein
MTQKIFFNFVQKHLQKKNLNAKQFKKIPENSMLAILFMTRYCMLLLRPFYK